MRVYQFRHVGTDAALLLDCSCLATLLRITTTTARCWCPRRDSNPYTRRHMDLNHARLPIPPRGHMYYRLLLHYFCCFTADNNENCPLLVPTEGIEPPHPKAHGPEPCASTNSATWALCCFAAFLLIAACSAATDKIIRVGAHSVNQHLLFSSRKTVFT